jgi:hypothetical protein
MQFPTRDLTNLFISSSYEDVVQRYDDGTSTYFLDGTGNVIAYIPTASVGQSIITSNQTASYSSDSDHSVFSDTSSVTTFSEFSGTASLAGNSYFAETASYGPWIPVVFDKRIYIDFAGNKYVYL